MIARILIVLAALIAIGGMAHSQTSQDKAPAGAAGAGAHDHDASGGAEEGGDSAEGGSGGSADGGKMGKGMMSHSMMHGGKKGPGMSMHGMADVIGAEMMGSGMLGAGPGALALDTKIPPEKRDAIREIHLTLAQSLAVKTGELQGQQLALTRAVHAFPIDLAAAKSAREAMQRLMSDMMAQRTEAMAKVQQVLGKELWEQVHPGWFGPRKAVGQSH